MTSTIPEQGARQDGLAVSARETAPGRASRATGARSEPKSKLSGRSILLLHDDPFVGSYIGAVLAGADAVVLGPASLVTGRALLGAGTGIDAVVLDFGMSDADSHQLADELGRQALPYLFVSGRSSCNGRVVLRGRPGLSWPFAGFEVCEALAEIVASARPARHPDAAQIT